jgi:transposase
LCFKFGYYTQFIFRKNGRVEYILASNQLEKAQLSHEELLDDYTPGQQKVERGFRFLKDPWFMANTLFLKSPKRIMAMTLCLLIYGALEYRIRQTLELRQQTFPHPT